ncbi:BEN domain-containing protein 3-like isoform X2 [Amblyraja radiata]|uniref:BEN domain-containing protein 3-like isoform X2 n=1 Tax=Amblyraja radiata TaxID=386614 RepID=UPI001403A626|nr:BEN domain-containing protein 3-like isoform X2 [Amblyraja radiata]
MTQTHGAETTEEKNTREREREKHRDSDRCATGSSRPPARPHPPTVGQVCSRFTMNSTEKDDESEFRTPFRGLNPSVSKDEELENEDTVANVNIEVVKTEVKMEDDEDEGGFSPDTAAENSSVPNALKRKQIHNGFGETTIDHESPISHKWRRLNCEDMLASLRGSSSSQRFLEGTSRIRETSDAPLLENDETVRAGPSFRKPLYGITHKISDRRSLLKGEQQSATEGGFFNSLLQQHHLTDGHKNYSSNLSPQATGAEPTLYSLIHKMFFTLNTLNSTMTQLHSKIDLLSLEVGRIKRHVSQGESVVDFPPPAEYRLNNSELKQLLEQSSSPGDLSCRLLLQLFPELLAEDQADVGCRACSATPTRKLDTLHLQLIRNYVEVCYPSGGNGDVWRSDCLPQLNDFFNSFWAQREMESSLQIYKVVSIDWEDHDMGQAQSNSSVEDNPHEEALSLDSFSSINSDLVLEAQEISEYLEGASSPSEFAALLLHRLFPELFDSRRLASQYSCCGSPGKLALDPQKMQVVRRYCEIYYPEVRDEEAWTELVERRLDQELECVHSDDSDSDRQRDESIGTSNALMVGSQENFERSTPWLKKFWLKPVNFNRLEIPAPDFEVPCPQHILDRHQLKNIYEKSQSNGNFASRLFVQFFPELFTPENLRKQYNCSGTLGKKQLDPVRIKLIRHYVQLICPRAKRDKTWKHEFMSKLDERCRRRDMEQRHVYRQERKKSIAYSDGVREEQMLAATQPEQVKRDSVQPQPVPDRAERYYRNFCKVPLHQLKVPTVDFPVATKHLVSTEDLKDIVQDSLSVANMCARLLVRIFPELFTSENLRVQYNHSGACNKKQLDPVRLRLIRHYVKAVYPRAKSDQVWNLECIPSIDERCRRPNWRKSKVTADSKDK